MFYVWVQIFDVIDTVQNFLETKQGLLTASHGVTSAGASLHNLVRPFQNNVQDTSAAMEIAYCPV